jgi:hypothetical protein
LAFIRFWKLDIGSNETQRYLMKTIFASKLLPSPVGGDELFRVRAEAEDLLDGD